VTIAVEESSIGVLLPLAVRWGWWRRPTQWRHREWSIA
jgi:hypothetical protein